MKIIIAFGASLLLSFIVAYPAMLLWNACLVPAIRIVNEVTWIQMWGIGFMFNIMFKTKLQFKV